MAGSGSEVFSGTVFPPGFWASGGTDDLGIYTGATAGTSIATLTGTLTRVGDLATAIIGGVTLTLRAYSDIANGVLFTTPDFATFYAFTFAPFDAAQGYAVGYTVAGQSELACFASGTRIATPQGERAVERLRPGNLVCAQRQGVARVRWVGRRRLIPCSPRAWPIRIAAHAVAPGHPRRALLLSPDHAVFLRGALIPARDLVNGTTILRLPVPAIEYWHVELRRHDMLRAEGLACESFLDTGNRRVFDAGGPHRRGTWTRDGCARLLLARAVQARVRRHLWSRAAALGHRATDDPGMTLLCSHGALALHRTGAALQALLLAGAAWLRLVSRSTVPAEFYPWACDARRLGVAVTHLALDGVAIPPDDPRRAAGWHRPEPGLHWTDGDALLQCGPAAHPRTVTLHLLPLLRYRIAASSASRTREFTGRWPGDGACYGDIDRL